ncbi:MAG: ribosomal protein S18-alanine N-acetyltransferase [Candidatus Bathyarchaeota archaeon]|nr:MAG: ribosomal protein S18-alanine N-acetyltransferase [Candidatus Bathyarchaeota archaeon]
MQTIFALRLFRPDDLEKVMHINKLCLPENYSSLFFMDLYERFPETFVVAEEDGEVVGYVMCRIETPFPGGGLLGIARKGHVISIAVLSSYRRHGVGSALMKKAMQAMIEYDAKECVLEVRASNTAGVSLYRKMGFNVKRTIRGYYADGETASVMAKKLLATPAEI